MKTTLEEIWSIDPKQVLVEKAKNQKTISNVQKNTQNQIDQLQDRITQYNSFHQFLIYFLALWLITLTSAFIYGYLKLDDSISNQADKTSERIAYESQSYTKRLDDMQQFNIKRLDEYILSFNSANSTQNTKNKK